MADSKEAEHTSESDQGDLDEGDAPGERGSAMLLRSDSYDSLYNYDEEPVIRRSSGSISAITRKLADKTNETSGSAEESSEDTNEVNTQSISDAVFETEVQDTRSTDSPQLNETDSSSVEPIEDEAYSEQWRQHKKHIFILSSSGKPVYSRHGNEDRLVTITGVMQALVSFVSDAGDSLRSMTAGGHRFVFLNREPLILVGVTAGVDSVQQMLIQLTYVYNQVLSVLTLTTLSKIFKQRRNYDLRRLLSGSEKFLDNLLNMMESEYGLLLGAVRCLPLDSSVRDIIAQSIVQHAKVKDLVFALIIANNQLVTLVRMKKYFLHPMDLHIILNLVSASEAFKTAESWTPICLPKFDPSGFLQAHVSYLDDGCQACLMLLSVDRESFFALSEAKNKIKERMIKYNALRAIGDSLQKTSYSIQQCGIGDLRHFLYKSRSTAQYTSPELEAPYLSQEEQERLFSLYQYLHHRIHTSGRPLKILYHVGQYETLLGWITQAFELYAVFGPLVTKTSAIHAVNKLLRWIKHEEDRLFILTSVTF